MSCTGHPGEAMTGEVLPGGLTWDVGSECPRLWMDPSMVHVRCSQMIHALSSYCPLI